MVNNYDLQGIVAVKYIKGLTDKRYTLRAARELWKSMSEEQKKLVIDIYIYLIQKDGRPK